MITSLLTGVRVLPVVTIHHAEDGVAIARALLAGGIRAIEITLRTPAALDAIAQVSRELPEMLVAAGTIVNATELVAARAAGAALALSPGLTRHLADAALELGFPFIPGVMTPSEVMFAHDHGFEVQKLFPAAAAGGQAMVKALAGPLGQVRFCPTGGIDQTNVAEWLQLSNVLCVGGSWLTPAAAIASRDWQQVENLARRATNTTSPQPQP